MMMLAQESKENQQAECDKMASMLRMLYDSYVKAGFSPKMAFELVKTTIMASISAGVKK